MLRTKQKARSGCWCSLKWHPHLARVFTGGTPCHLFQPAPAPTVTGHDILPVLSQNSIDDYLENSRMKRLSLVLIPIALLFMTACQTGKTVSTPNANNSSPAANSTPDQFAAARASYEKNCKLCHGANGEGGPVKLDDGTKLKVPSLREGHALKHPDSDFVKQITKGGDGMPAFGEKLKPEEINDMIRFIRQEFQGGKTPPTK